MAIPKKDELEVGQKVLVYYDSVDPKNNALTDFGDLSLNALGPVPLMLFGMGAVAFYIGSRRRRNQRAMPPSSH